ncbi:MULTISPECIES: hypothetical protein [unclassified Pseudomonas]|uniref:hypothetical protein n=1 Tax=unclassified Pseudomonas TaxID=196821 RepID=UPI000BD68221|nr:MULTISPECIES: hypothetical protein [unclassified Pseudomonas]PVZ19959.1 hypothetical protein F474_00550 [Pseudomonas sp. URIL14HWK12:I12]PVZ27025.1 hypothetical protein F470_00205 [Pseudomonas sp. URIL14HWK12:I10]PVZ37914.1 hypothetical protein F472_00550 [Pseudomonas sp. URIL14HWK12:I11]SNZ05162.1 hypothetical protein SAMN05660463_00854 [Pseudomonas sp. URIL14HWK12:I9]
MTTSPVKTLADEQLEEVEFAGKTKEAAQRLAQRLGFEGQPSRYGWVAPGIWLLRYPAPSPLQPQ